MQHLKRCPICNSDFITVKRTKKTCSLKCQRKLEAEEKIRAKEREKWKQAGKTIKITDNLAAKELEAREKHMSYGKLQALKYIKENKI